MDDLSGVVHAWAEFGLTYGRVVMEKDKHFLKAGATIKYLAGAGGVFGFSPNLSANYNSTNEALTTAGNLNYGYTSGFDSECETAVAHKPTSANLRPTTSHTLSEGEFITISFVNFIADY